MTELEQNMNLSKYLIKSLMSKIPAEMITVKTKQKFKFYSITLEKLNALILEQSINAIQNAE
jgi:hypothetical protein